MDSVRSLIGLEEEESSEFLERGGLDVEGLCPSLSYKQVYFNFIILLIFNLIYQKENMGIHHMLRAWILIRISGLYS